MDHCIVQAFELAWGRGVALPVVNEVVNRRCRHVEQEPGEVGQAAGDVKDVTVLGLEANGDHLEEKHDDPVLLEDAHVAVDLGIIREEQGIIIYIDYVCRHPSLCKIMPALGRSLIIFKIIPHILFLNNF